MSEKSMKLSRQPYSLVVLMEYDGHENWAEWNAVVDFVLAKRL
jgi:hypothetical protein